MKKVFLFLLLVTVIPKGWTQQYPVNQYTSKQYNAHTLMWDMVEDNQGRLWFANNDGVVRFDGNNWTTFSTPNPVRNLVITKRNEIFVACLEDFGVLTFTGDGGTSYTSFKSQIDASQLVSGEEKVFLVNDRVYFSTGHAIVSVTEQNGAYMLTMLDKEKTLGCGVSGQKLWVNRAREGLGKLENGHYIPVANAYELAGKQLVQKLSFGGHDYIFTGYDGIYQLKQNTLSRLTNAALNQVTIKGIAGATVIDGQLLAIATYHDGVRVFNTSLQEVLMPELPSREIYAMGVDHEHNLWVAHHKGLTQVLTGLPVRLFQYPEVSGNINAILRVNESLYLSTSNGLFVASNDLTKIEVVQGMNNECWDIEFYGGSLYAATTNGLYRVTGNKANLIIPNETFVGLQVANVSKGLYAFGVNGVFKVDEHGKASPVKGVKVLANSIVENKDGSIWIGTNHNGLQRAGPSQNNQKGIPEVLSSGEVRIGMKGQQPFFQSKDGVYTIEESGFAFDEKLSQLLSGNKTPNLVLDKQTWFFTDREWKYMSDETLQPAHVAYALNGRPTAFFHESDQDWFAAEDKIYLVKSNASKQEDLRASIGKVTYGQSGNVFSGIVQENNPEMGNEQNITIWFGINSFVNPSKHQYRYKISGLNSYWSEWSSESKIVLNGLWGGTYTLELEARDAFGNPAAPCSFSFYVKPPWYFSSIAFLGYILGFVALSYGAVLLYNKRLVDENKILEKKVEERTAELKTEKQKSDSLLLNILPEEVAEELKTKGFAEAKQYNHVSVLFTDMVNFTGISEQMTPKELVAEIHKNFTAFDDIIGKYGLEKIKTIGDAYLAVGGLPEERGNHAIQVVNAAIAIQQYINESGGKFRIRIGVHSGAVVAGIVGIKKYAFDIWGDTVNTAARMEQTSEAGKINISGATYELIKDHFVCTYRGKINAKGKGEVDMYFVNGSVGES